MASAKEKRLRHLQRIYNPTPSVDNSPPISYLLRNRGIPIKQIPLRDTHEARMKKKALFHRSSESVCSEKFSKISFDRPPVELKPNPSRVSSATCSWAPRDSGISSCSATPEWNSRVNRSRFVETEHLTTSTPSQRIADRIDDFLRELNSSQTPQYNQPGAPRRDKGAIPRPRQKKYLPVEADPFIRYPSAFTRPGKPFTPRLTVKSNEIEAWLKTSRSYNAPRPKSAKRFSASSGNLVQVEEKVSPPSGDLVRRNLSDEEDNYSSDQVEEDEEDEESESTPVTVASDREPREAVAPSGALTYLAPTASSSHDSAFDNDGGISPVDSCSGATSSALKELGRSTDKLKSEIELLADLDSSLKELMRNPSLSGLKSEQLDQLMKCVSTHKLPESKDQLLSFLTPAKSESTPTEVPKDDFLHIRLEENVGIMGDILEDLRISAAISRETQQVLFSDA